MKRKKIALLGLFGQQNLGNDCTLSGIIYNILSNLPNAGIICICTGPENIVERHNIPAFLISERYLESYNSEAGFGQNHHVKRLLRKIFIRIPTELLYEFRRWIEAFRILNGSDMLIIPGTGFLTDAYTGTFGWPYDIFKWSIIAKLCRSKLLFVSVGAGPIYTILGRWFIKTALSLADFRSYRDTSTKKYLESIRFRASNDMVTPDLAFNLPETVIPQGDKHKGRKPVVGVGLMSVAGKLSVDSPDKAKYHAYLEKLVIFVKWLIAHDYDVRLLIGDVLYDRPVIKEFWDLLKKNEVQYDEGQIIEEPIFSFEHLLSQLAATDLVVATRFHNVLLALILNRPVISISFHHKCISLMSSMGLSEYCQDMHDIDIKRLIEQFIKLKKNADNLKLHIKRKTEEYRKTLDEQYRYIFNDV